jgi:hypothetical protein
MNSTCQDSRFSLQSDEEASDWLGGQGGEWGDAELAQALFYNPGIERAETDAIERDVSGEYRSRGGAARGKRDEGGERLGAG